MLLKPEYPLVEFADKYGLREDWHEPDEQSVRAVVVGNHLDNAYGDYPRGSEFNIVLSHEDRNGNEPDMCINLASLLADYVRLSRIVEAVGKLGV